MAKYSKKKNFEDFIEFLFGLDVLFTALIYFKVKNNTLTVIAFVFLTSIIIISLSLYKSYKRKELINSGVDKVDSMSGEDFEDFLMAHFIKLGYKVEGTPTTGDYGADLVVSKDSKRIVIQAKRWKRNVGIEAVQQVIGSIKYYKATGGMVITNSYFTPNAENLAKANGIELWDRDKLIKVMKSNSGMKIANSVTKKDISSNLNCKSSKVHNEKVIRKEKNNKIYTDTKICPRCQGTLVLRNGKNGKFYGCSNFPKCRFTKNYFES